MVHEGRVFLCHSSGDKRRIRRLHQRLEKDGITCWLDEVDLLPGQDWDLEIRKAIRESDFVLACVSKNSVNKRGYVQKEIREALDVADEQPDGAIYLIPVRLEDCELPARLQGKHAVDLHDARGYDKLLKALRSGSPPEEELMIPDERSVERSGMLIKVVDQVYDEDLAGSIWDLHVAAATMLNRVRIDRSLMFRSQFDELMYDPRVSKYLALGDDGALRGFAGLTNDLDALPGISPEYFEAGWPDLYRSKRIWICDLAAVRGPDDKDAYFYFFEQLWLLAGTQDGIIGINRGHLTGLGQEMLRDFEPGRLRRIGPLESTTFALYEPW